MADFNANPKRTLFNFHVNINIQDYNNQPGKKEVLFDKKIIYQDLFGP